MQINYNKNNKISIRNFSEAVDLHDIIKLLLVRQLRRKHPNINNCQIYTEHSIREIDNNFPDIQMIMRENYRKPVNFYNYELQEAMSPAWLAKMQETYEDTNLIIVNLKEVKKEWKKSKIKDPIKSLNKVLEKYVV